MANSIRIDYNSLRMFRIESAQFIKGIRGTDPILIDGIPQIAFAGRSNVGKSSVISSLLGKKDLVRTSKRPGQTTEINFFLVNKKYYFVDLPGYGYAKLSLEQREKLRKLIIWYLTYSGTKPSAVILIVDIKVGLTELDQEMIRVLDEQNHNFLIVANKSDKLNQKEVSQQIAKIKVQSGVEDVLAYSAEKKTGFEQLMKILFAE